MFVEKLYIENQILDRLYFRNDTDQYSYLTIQDQRMDFTKMLVFASKQTGEYLGVVFQHPKTGFPFSHPGSHRVMTLKQVIRYEAIQ